MRLIKVEAHGFKSFADKVILNFDGGIVAIVGPNGSGKSNINDAIKWVLGEQSSKSLRGDSMEDVIFSGSKTVSAMKTAEVTLTFDNSDHAVSLPHDFISVTRRLTRGKGSNQYFINGEIARLKDIKEINMESGMSKSSLAIISQGTISDIAQASPIDRRGIFEEAAGISKYKKRKMEALKKLEKTDESLEQLKTVIRELERQLNPLKRQSEKARIYLEKASELKDVEVGLIVEDVSFFKEKLEKLNLELENVFSTKAELEDRIESSANDVESKTSYKLNLENEILILDDKYKTVSEKIRDIELKESQAEQRRKMIIDGQITSSSEAKILAMREQLGEFRDKLIQYNSWRAKATSDVTQKKESVAKVDVQISSLRLSANSNQQKLYKVKSKIDILRDHKENKTNLFKGTKVILENKSIFSGVHGIVADAFEVIPQYRIAIETILQNALQHIVVDKSDDAVQAIEFLKKNRAGRATFIPLRSIQPKGIREEHLLVLKSQPGYLGIASDLISTEAQFVVLKRFLLGNVVIVDTIQSANRISQLLNKRYMVVSLDGDIIRIGGVMSGGEKSKSKDLLGIDDKIKKLKGYIPILEKEILASSTQINELFNRASEDRAIIGELYVEIAKVNEKSENTHNQFNFLKTKYESQSNKKVKFEDKDVLEKSSEFLLSEKSSLKATLTAKREKIISLNYDLTSSITSKTELEKSLREIMSTSSEKMNQKNQAEFYVNSSVKRLSEEYQMTLEIAAEDAVLSMDREDARTIVSELKAEIKALGHINVDAIESYEEVKTRHDKLSHHEHELESAQQTILSAIDQMDQIIITKLDVTVKSVAVEFQNVFKTMFGGGHAEIKYTDPSNLLETGIEIVAQPPGKAVRNLKLFSGGEKAIIAISLLFAILKSKPLPLCILDEVEAALDEANVARYADFLQQLKGSTQFIVITHRVGTMERVDHLFGATMQQRGVTSFFSVKLKTAKTLIKDN